jgi:sortase A
MKKLIISFLTLALCASVAAPAIAYDYAFDSGPGDWAGRATSTDEPVSPDTMSENVRRNKDAAYLPPPYFYGSGDIPTEPSSLYHANLPESGFVSPGQQLPPVGDEWYAPGSSEVSSGLLPSTSVTGEQKTVPLYYADGSIGALYIHKLGKTILVYEGESLENMKKGIGHFSGTSAWDGNCGFAGHNRGAAAYFSFVKDLAVGDRITYSTLYGVRTYEVYRKDVIGDTDYSGLGQSADNIISLITCVADQPSLRYLVQARETV